ncbi:MAG: hypothetical protein J0H57_10445, partial [Rhodospirillales bacterium]|nr:hypothetical protein [Rhodospirillales bacterium]
MLPAESLLTAQEDGTILLVTLQVSETQPHSNRVLYFNDAKSTSDAHLFLRTLYLAKRAAAAAAAASAAAASAAAAAGAAPAPTISLTNSGGISVSPVGSPNRASPPSSPIPTSISCGAISAIDRSPEQPHSAREHPLAAMAITAAATAAAASSVPGATPVAKEREFIEIGGSRERTKQEWTDLFRRTFLIASYSAGDVVLTQGKCSNRLFHVLAGTLHFEQNGVRIVREKRKDADSDDDDSDDDDDDEDEDGNKDDDVAGVSPRDPAEITTGALFGEIPFLLGLPSEYSVIVDSPTAKIAYVERSVLIRSCSHNVQNAERATWDFSITFFRYMAHHMRDKLYRVQKRLLASVDHVVVYETVLDDGTIVVTHESPSKKKKKKKPAPSPASGKRKSGGGGSASRSASASANNGSAAISKSAS